MKNTRLTLYFPPNLTCQAFTWDLVKNYDWKINIIRASISEGQEGRLLMDVEAEGQKLKDGLAYLAEAGIIVKDLEKQVYIDMEICISCGVCTGVCLPNALVMDKETWELKNNPEKCIVCGLCEGACPVQAIKIGF